MRRIAIALTVLVLGAGSYACSSDAPSPTTPKGPDGQPPSGSSGLVIRLFTSNPNPPEESCTIIQAIVTRNGQSVPDGTSVSFSSNFGVFEQNLLNVISVVTQNGAATTAICSNDPGSAAVTARVTEGNDTESATITIAFQPVAQLGPFVTFCDPSFGPPSGGTSLNISGGRFFGSPGSTRVVFSAGGATREALVTNLTGETITVVTPAFPEAQSPSVPVEIRVTLGTNTSNPITLSLPNCFAFGTGPSTQPSITAVLPSSGPNEGNTRVTIIGSGFRAPLQVFFGEVEAQVLSITFNQIIVLTPAAFGAGAANLNAQVPVRVRLVDSGVEASPSGTFRYVVDNVITSISPSQLEVTDLGGALVTIFGHGFQAPVAVSLAGIPAVVVSVSATEIVVQPGRPFINDCQEIGGESRVVNVNTGDVAVGPAFIYLVERTRPVIASMTPNRAQRRIGDPGPDIPIEFTGPNVENADVARFGPRTADVTVVGEGRVTANLPFSEVLTAPACPEGVMAGFQIPVETVGVTLVDLDTNCGSTPPVTFTYTLPCVVPTATPTATVTPTTTPAGP
ncbi:MAG: IPT/TIG domain-containing protein [Thermoanaerobaculia bacterium]